MQEQSLNTAHTKTEGIQRHDINKPNKTNATIKTKKQIITLGLNILVVKFNRHNEIKLNKEN